MSAWRPGAFTQHERPDLPKARPHVCRRCLRLFTLSSVTNPHLEALTHYISEHEHEWPYRRCSDSCLLLAHPREVK